MAATPKKPRAASGSSFFAKKKRSPFALAAAALLVAAVCGVIAAAFVFSGPKSDNSIVATVSSGTDQQIKGATAPVLESVGMDSDDGVSCEQQKCKVGGSEVCGTDGKTYLNDCFFKNAQCKNSSIQKVENWKGFNCPNTCKKKIACKEIGKYLCATDGNVYFGYCNLYVAQCLDSTIQEVKCDKAIFDGMLRRE